MINPLRSEEDAFRFTVVVAILVAPIALAAVLISTEAGLAVAGGLLLGIVFTLLWLRRDEGPERATLRRRPRDDRRRRILVVANETLSGAALRDEIERHAGGRATEVFVVCPALNTKLKTWTSDDDEARAQAQARLQAMLDALERSGLVATGDIGDGDPVQAMEDGLRICGADEVIVSTHPPGRSNWLERDVVERARERLDVPITHVVVDLERDRGLAPPAAT